MFLFSRLLCFPVLPPSALWDCECCGKVHDLAYLFAMPLPVPDGPFVLDLRPEGAGAASFTCEFSL